MTATQPDNESLVRESFEAFNDRDEETFVELHADGVVAHTSVGEFQGPGAVMEPQWELFEAFPDLAFVVEDVVAEGDRVAARYTVTGTHEAEYRGIEPTGEEVEFSNIGVFRVDDGRIAEVWIVSDVLGFMQQLGVVEFPGE